jgi:putative CocE/NonD family hydrolase
MMPATVVNQETEGPARPVGRVSRWLSVFFGRRLSFPPATNLVTVRRVAVPMRDGVRLDADLLTPLGTSRATMLVRSPYGIRNPLAVIFSLGWAERGFTVLHQSCRGTFNSQGRFDPMRQEAADGQDTVAWLREQSWFDGSLILTGGSYLGYVQWALLQDPPPEVIAAVAMTAPHDLGRSVYRHGVLDLENMLGWSEAVAHQNDHGFLGTIWRAITAPRRLAPILRDFSRGRLDPDLVRAAPWFREWAEHDGSDEFWKAYDVTAGVERTRVPTLIVAGWHDLFLEQSLEQYRTLVRRGVPTRLVVGPWVHLDTVRTAGEAWTEAFRWLDRVLAKSPDLAVEQSVRLWVGGAAEWRELERWPAAKLETWYLGADGRLGPQHPNPSASASFTYRPDDPTPSVGGALMTPGAGAADNRPLEQRADVLTFTGDVVREPVTVIGEVTVELELERDNAWADLFVRLSDVEPSGRSINLCDGIRRLTKGDPSSGLVSISLGAVAHRFEPGHRARLLVAGGAFPRFSSNPGTGRMIDTPDGFRSTTWTVRLGGRSVVRLPL